MEETTLTCTLNSPLTDDDWDKITDVDFDNTSAVTFRTKHGKEVEFVKVVRCKDCENSYVFEPWDVLWQEERSLRHHWKRLLQLRPQEGRWTGWMS